MVGEVVTHLPATPEPCVRLSRLHGSSSHGSLSLILLTVSLIVTVSVHQREVSTPIIPVVVIAMMDL